MARSGAKSIMPLHANFPLKTDRRPSIPSGLYQMCLQNLPLTLKLPLGKMRRFASRNNLRRATPWNASQPTRRAASKNLSGSQVNPPTGALATERITNENSCARAMLAAVAQRPLDSHSPLVPTIKVRECPTRPSTTPSSCLG